MTPPTGQDMVNLVTSILGGQAPNPAYILQIINLFRTQIEGQKPWRFLVAMNNQITLDGSNTYTTPIPLPTVNVLTNETVQFMRFMLEGSVILFNNSQDYEDISEIPYEAILDYYDDYGWYAVDYSARNMYFTGLIPTTYNLYLYFIADYGPITLTTTWKHVPYQFANMLAFYAAARWRLGTSWDDIAARNADDNFQAAEALRQAMDSWDTELNIAAFNAVDYKNDRYPGIVGGAGSSSSNWPWRLTNRGSGPG